MTPNEILFDFQSQGLDKNDLITLCRRRQTILQLHSSPSLDNAPETNEDALLNFILHRTNVYKTIYHNRKKEQERRKLRYNKGVRLYTFKPGDLVMRRILMSKQRKLEPRWSGPWKILEPAGKHGISWMLQNVDTGVLLFRRCHGDDLKLYLPRKGYLATYNKELDFSNLRRRNKSTRRKLLQQ